MKKVKYNSGQFIRVYFSDVGCVDGICIERNKAFTMDGIIQFEDDQVVTVGDQVEFPRF